MFDLGLDQYSFDLELYLLQCQQTTPQFERFTKININFFLMLGESCELAVALLVSAGLHVSSDS